MNCQEARTLIDDRVHGSLPAELNARLDEHLKGCADCRDDLRQLTKVRELLADVRSDAPSHEQLAVMFQAIRHRTAHNSKGTSMTASLSARPAASIKPISNRRWRLVAAASLSAAALLLVSFMLGVREYAPKIQDALRSKGGATMASAPESPQRTYGNLTYDAVPAQGLYNSSGASSSGGSAVGGENSGGFQYNWMSPADKDAQFRTENAPAASDKAGFAFNAPAPAPAPVLPPPVKAEAAPAQEREKKLSQKGSWQDVDETNEGKLAKSIDAPKVVNKGKADGDTRDPAKADDSGAVEKSKPKIIKTGELTVEVKNFTDASRSADALVIKFGGFVADSRTFDLPGATKRGEIVIRVNPDKFEELFAELKKLGMVLNERAGGQDITAAYTDTVARIKNLQIAEERLQELIKSKSFIDKITSLLEVERELSRVRGEIESMQGQMRVWENQLSLSTIRLTITEPSRPVPSGSMSVEVGALTDAKARLDAAIATAGGQLTSGQTQKRSDGTLMGTYGVRVKFARFAEVLTAVRGLGRVQDEQLQNQPVGGVVPEGAGDVPCEFSLVIFERSIQLPGANLYIEVPSMNEAVAKMNAALAENQGSLVNNQTQRQPDGTTHATITVRVRAGNFSALLDQLTNLGRLTNRNVSGEAGKVQGGAADVPVQISLNLFEQKKQVPSGSMGIEVEKFTAARDTLIALVKDQGLQVQGSDSQQRTDGTWAGSFRLSIRADKMDETVTALEKLGRVKVRNLQGLGLGDLSKVDPNVYGEVLLSLEEKPALAPQEEGAFRLMLRETFGGFLNSMGYIIRGLGMIVPWLLLGGLLVWLIWRFTRNANSPAVATTTTTTTPEGTVETTETKREGSGRKKK